MAEVEVWSLELKGGSEEVVTLPADVRLTNISFGEELPEADGRSVIKLGYLTISGDDLESDDEEDEDAPGPEPTYTTTVLTALTAGKVEQSTVNLVLLEDKEYVLTNTGKNTVFVTGNYIQHDNEEPYGEDELDSDEEGYDLEDVSSDVEMHPDDLDDLESDASRFEEVVEEAPKAAKRPRDSEAAAEKPKEAKEKKNKKLKAEDGKAAPAPAAEAPKKEKEKKEKAAEKPKEKELPGGLKIKDVKIGDGAEAKKGSRVGMRYIGKLTNGNVFDKNVKGKPFYFKVGKGEVIKGWDQGIPGMKVGGERVLTVPASLAYGKQKLDGIPPNSTLIFEVKLLEVK